MKHLFKTLMIIVCIFTGIGVSATENHGHSDCDTIIYADVSNDTQVEQISFFGLQKNFICPGELTGVCDGEHPASKCPGNTLQGKSNFLDNFKSFFSELFKPMNRDFICPNELKGLCDGEHPASECPAGEPGGGPDGLSQ